MAPTASDPLVLAKLAVPMTAEDQSVVGWIG